MVLPTLPVRPKPEILTISDLLALAERGKLRIPRFQTGLRWGPRHVEELFDSITRGFPIGGLLLWKRPAPEQLLTFGPVSVDAPELPDAFFIVDGQQRITALVGSLLHPDELPLGDSHSLWVDLVSGAFQVWGSRPPPTWIPVRQFGDRRRLQHWARTAEFGAQTHALVDRAFSIEEAIIRYPVTAYVVEDASQEALRLIFSRTNSSGVPLKEDQVFDALFQDAGTPKPLDFMATWLDEQTGFGRLPSAWLLRCVKAVGALDPRRSITEHDPMISDLLVATHASMRRAVTFLQTEAGFLHASLLPYRFPLIVLARFFHLHPEPHPRTRSLLTRWVWRGALSGTHGDSSQGAVAAQLGDLGSDEHGSTQRLLGRVPISMDLPDPMSGWYGQAAATRLYATAMLEPVPLDPVTELPWDRETLLSSLSERSLGRLFRRPSDDTARSIAARVLLPPRYRRLLLLQASEEVLASLLIPPRAAAALRDGDDDRFLSERASALCDAPGGLVERFAAPGQNDRPPISAITAAAS